MEKGFTLVELLAVIVLIAVVSLFVAPNVVSIFDKTREDASNQQKEYIERMAKQYVSEFSYEIVFSSGVATILLSDLKEAGYITGDVINPTDGSEYCDLSYIEITQSGNEYDYEVFLYKYDEGPCS